VAEKKEEENNKFEWEMLFLRLFFCPRSLLGQAWYFRFLVKIGNPTMHGHVSAAFDQGKNNKTQERSISLQLLQR